MLFKDVEEIFFEEGNVLYLEAKSVLVVGDTHGYIDSTNNAIKYGKKSDAIIFLGDYVDRGPAQLENINLLFNEKIRNPKHVILLRGNHETRLANMYYGFMNAAGENYYDYLRVFRVMPVAAVVNNKYIMVHGGLPKEVSTIEDIEKLPRNDEEVSDPVLLQLLWNDPSENIPEFGPSIRGDGIYFFGQRPLERFLSRNNLKMMIRAHEVKENGYSYLFANKLLSLFSATGYMGLDIKGKAAFINEDSIQLVDV